MFFPVPLYHGTSSHFETAFSVGCSPVAGEFSFDEAIQFYRKIVSIFHSVGLEIESWFEDIAYRRTGYANWRHGVLHASPSLITAQRYADTGAKRGGELLAAADYLIEKLDASGFHGGRELLLQYPRLQRFFRSEGHPLIVELADVPIASLQPERDRDTIEGILNFIHEVRKSEMSEHLHVMLQQHNVRIADGAGVVASITRL